MARDSRSMGSGAVVGFGGGKLCHLAGEGRSHAGAGAAKTPVGIGHFTDEAVFREVRGAEVFRKFVQESLVFGGVVAGQQDG